jgi:hypothetical protein
MTAPAKPKKSETLEVRLPHQTKTAFMARCRDDGQTASEAVRGFIEAELVAGPRRARSRLWQMTAAAAAGLALGAVAAPSLARTVSADEAAFARLDRNHDGALSLAEFRR